MIRYIDSHTGGEPTRLVIDGGPDLGSGDLAKRRQVLSEHHDWLRRALILEPRGCDWLVGGLLTKPVNPQNDAGVIFFNNSGYLGMCGHGLIGLVTTLKHLGQVTTGSLRIETPVGEVQANLDEAGNVSVTNVESYRIAKDVVVEVPGVGSVVGDIAYGGNWFFLVGGQDLDGPTKTDLLQRSQAIMDSLEEQGISGEEGAKIDHIELFGAPLNSAANSRSFVLCPGGEYDRSPCGTGTSAKLACLAADQRLAPGETWVQESIIGSCFHASFQPGERGIIPRISGRAYVTAESKMVVEEADVFRFGIAPTP